MKVHQLFEASTPGRAWSGKLQKIDKLLSWMYERDILTASEKAEKDKLFRSYYRYYNDGDRPHGMKYEDPAVVEKHLESKVETFIKKILGKYWSTIDRAEFNVVSMIEKLDSIIRATDWHDVHGLLNYYLKDVKLKDDGGVLAGLVAELSELNTDLRAKIQAKDSSLRGKTASYAIQELKDAGKADAALLKTWDKTTANMAKIAVFLRDLKKSIKDANAAKLLGYPDKD